MQIRFHFSRGEELKFIGHLDVMRLFERAFKRSGIPVSHSHGFNPRPQIVFAQPMPLGLSSDGEFADVKLDDRCDTGVFMAKINKALPDSIRVLDAREKTSTAKIMGIVGAARYRVDFKIQEDCDIEYIISNVLNQKRIIVLKKTKSGEKEKDIRPLIYRLSGNITEGTYFFDVFLSAGQENNVRPELFIDGVSSCINLDIEMLKMHRFMLYGRRGDKWLSLMDDELL